MDLPHTVEVSYGGAVAYKRDCSVKFNNCDILENDATVGGGIYGFECLSEVADCNVYSNEAYLGAGAFLEDKKSVITATRFEANRAKIADVIIEPPADDPPQDDDPNDLVVPIATSEITGEGAGLFAHVQDLEIRDSVFVENRAGLSGGGLFLTGTTEQPSDIFNSLFIQNTARIDGAAASVNWKSEALFGNCTFANNVATGVYIEVETGEFEPVIDPDTGEPVLDDDDNPVLIPITTPVQVSEGTGGALNVSYDSVAEVIDSIFWYNFADRGDSIYLGTNQTYERPSELTVSYSDVANYPSANAIFVEDGCTLNLGAGIFSQDPLFVTLPDAPVGDVTSDYYLNQLSSPCINQGSDFASSIGLSNYTTSIFGAFDKGRVDLGYHYPKEDVDDCRLADLVLSGKIDLSDWAVFASEWISLTGTCGEGNGWCSGADQNFDTEVNVEDLMNFGFCWLEEDTEAPFPSPAQWELEPNALYETYDTIEMIASLHFDKWWPTESLEYYFDCLVPPDGPDSGWISSREYTVSGLAPASYQYVVRVRDPRGNVTANSVSAVVTPGENTLLPAGQWLEPPFIRNDQLSIEMEALAYEDFDTIGITVPTLPAGYVIKYQFDYTGTAEGGDGRFYDLNPVYVDVGMVEDQTYSYRVRMSLFYEPGDGTSLKIQDGPWSTEASVVAVLPDLIPPEPNPAEIATGYPTAILDTDNNWYHIIAAVEATDDSGVEYRFVCSAGDALSSGGSLGGGPRWRNEDNVGAGLQAEPEDVFYSNPSSVNTLQVPQEFHVLTISKHPEYTWYVIVRDRSPLNNMTEPSPAVPITNP